MDNNNFRIELLKEEQCEEAASVRFEERELSFLPSLGVNFLIEVLKSTAKSKWGFGLVCLEGEKLVGLSLVATDLKKYYLDILFRRGIFLAFWGLMELVKNKNLIKRTFDYFLFPIKIPYHDIKAQWLTLIIKKEYRNKGIGRKLTLSLIEEFKRRNVKKFKSTVFLYNKVSRLMHHKYGFKSLGTFQFDKEQLELYIYNINDREIH